MARLIIVRKASPKFRIVQKRAAPKAELVIIPKERLEEFAKQVAESQNKERKFLRFDAQVDLSAAGAKKFDVVKDADGSICDYQNVTIKGYLSTFGNSDRDGEVVRPGAFKDTVADFMRNPVLLADHTNKTSSLCGSFTTVREDSKGLYVEGALSNSSDDSMKRIRALVAEGHLRTMSMGGIFYTEGNEIFRVSLFEGSLIPIPANPQALFSVRECTEHEAKRWQFDPNPAE